MKDCVFCKIVKGEISAEKIYDDKNVYAFLDMGPVNPGHTLVIPKEHYKIMAETPDNILARVFVVAKKLMKVIKKTMKADFVAVSVVGVDVPHFHVHLVPRYFNDGMANFWPHKKYRDGEIEKVGEKIRKGFG